VQEGAVAHDVGQAEVGDLDVVVGVQQQVLGLEVAVHHAVEVAVPVGWWGGTDQTKPNRGVMR